MLSDAFTIRQSYAFVPRRHNIVASRSSLRMLCHSTAVIYMLCFTAIFSEMFPMIDDLPAYATMNLGITIGMMPLLMQAALRTTWLCLCWECILMCILVTSRLHLNDQAGSNKVPLQWLTTVAWVPLSVSFMYYQEYSSRSNFLLQLRLLRSEVDKQSMQKEGKS